MSNSVSCRRWAKVAMSSLARMAWQKCLDIGGAEGMGGEPISIRMTS
jgi:hypothetical protein